MTEIEIKETKRRSEDGSDAGGGLMSVMRGGRVFEKVGVNMARGRPASSSTTAAQNSTLVTMR